jgi:hypothetical protein
MNLQSNSGTTGSLEDASSALRDILKDENKLIKHPGTIFGNVLDNDKHDPTTDFLNPLYSIGTSYNDMLEGEHKREELIRDRLKLINERLNLSSSAVFLNSGQNKLTCAGSWNNLSKSILYLNDKELNDEEYDIYQLMPLNNKIDKENLFEDVHLLNSNSTKQEDKGYIDIMRYIFSIDKNEFQVYFIPIHGFTRTYGYLLALVINDNLKMFKLAPESQVETLRQATTVDIAHIILDLSNSAARIGSSLKEAKRGEQLRFINFLQSKQKNWPVMRHQIIKGNYNELFDFLNFLVKFLALSDFRCVNSAALRLRHNDYIYEVASATYKEKGEKDRSPRSINERSIVSAVFNDVKDRQCDLTNPSDRIKYNLKNEDWIVKNEFGKLYCLVLVFNQNVIGSLSLFAGKHQYIAQEDLRYLRIVADLVTVFLSGVLFDNQTEHIHVDMSYMQLLLDKKYPFDKIMVPEVLQSRSFSIIAVSEASHVMADRFHTILIKSNIKTKLVKSLPLIDDFNQNNFLIVLIDNDLISNIDLLGIVWSKILLLHWNMPDLHIIPVLLDEVEVPIYIENFMPHRNNLSTSVDIDSLLNYALKLEMNLKLTI